MECKVDQATLPGARDTTRSTFQRIDRRRAVNAASLNDAALLRRRARGVRRARGAMPTCVAKRLVLQEESDWYVMVRSASCRASAYSSLEAAPPINVGERAFEIVLARLLARTEANRTGSTKLARTADGEPPRHLAQPITESMSSAGYP